MKNNNQYATQDEVNARLNERTPLRVCCPMHRDIELTEEGECSVCANTKLYDEHMADMTKDNDSLTPRIESQEYYRDDVMDAMRHES